MVRELYNKSKIFQNIKSLNQRFKTDDKEQLQLTIEYHQKLGDTAAQLLLNTGTKVIKRKYTHSKPFSAGLNKIVCKYHKAKNKIRHMSPYCTTKVSAEYRLG
jgi:hypothetical protein